MYKLVVAIIRHEKLESVTSALKKEQIGFTYYHVKGFCKEVHLYHDDIHDRVKVEIVADANNVEKIKELITVNACCGMEGDGCISVYVIDEFIMFS